MISRDDKPSIGPIAIARRSSTSFATTATRFVVLLLLMSGCAVGGYGELHSVGERLSTSCVTVTSFDPLLRSSPGLRNPDAYVGYFDLGGIGRNPVFLVAPIADADLISAITLLRAADPRHSTFWSEAVLQSGDPTTGAAFEVVVPPKERHLSPQSTLIEREAIVVRAHLHKACGRNYLVAVQANPSTPVEEWAWTYLRKNYDLFVSNLTWRE